MNDNFKKELPRLIKKLLDEKSIEKRENQRDYDLINENLKDCDLFFKKIFGIELENNLNSISLKKVSIQNPIGLGDNVKKEVYALLCLAFSNLCSLEMGTQIIFNKFMNEVFEQFNALTNADLNIKNQIRYKNIIKKYLIEDNKYLEKIDEDEINGESDMLLSLKKTIREKDFRAIDLNRVVINNRTKENKNYIKIAQFILLNGCLSLCNNKELYELMQDDKNRDMVFNIFDKLQNDDNSGYNLMQWNDTYILIYRGEKDFPNTFSHSGSLAIEVIDKIKDRDEISFEEVEEIAKDTITYKKSKSLKSSLSSEVRRILKYLQYYEFINRSKKKDNNYFVNESCKSISIEVIENNESEEIIGGIDEQLVFS